MTAQRPRRSTQTNRATAGSRLLCSTRNGRRETDRRRSTTRTPKQGSDENHNEHGDHEEDEGNEAPVEVTMAAALVSAFTGRPVHGDLAMTGEITLSGQVLRGGGIEEKVARGAPLRAGPRRPAAGEPPTGRRGPRRQRGRSPTRSRRSTTCWSWGGGLRRRRLRCGGGDSGRAGVLRAWEEGAGGNTGHEGVRRPWPAVAEHGKHRRPARRAPVEPDSLWSSTSDPIRGGTGSSGTTTPRRGFRLWIPTT